MVLKNNLEILLEYFLPMLLSAFTPTHFRGKYCYFLLNYIYVTASHDLLSKLRFMLVTFAS